MAPSPATALPSPRSADARKLRRARAEARDCLTETRALVQRHARRLPPAQRTSLETAASGVEAAAAGQDLEAIERALAALDPLVAAHLGFARRAPGLEYALSIAKALAVALVLRLFVIEAYKIPSGSMIPSLLIGDHIFVNKLSYGLRFPVVHWLPLHWGGYRRGEVVVFANPLDDALPLLNRRDYIKRIVGLSGDVVEVKGEVLYVNGSPQARRLERERFDYFDRLGDAGPWIGVSEQLWDERLENSDGRPVEHPVMRDADRVHLPYEGPFRVPAGHLFMMGDNRDNSQDGRAGGWFVPFDHVKGHALFVWWSWGKPGTWSSEEPGLRAKRLFSAVR
jgi:signal peptidase I